jgi:ATP-dependent RNA helicase SUPV3L1/SUV3
VGFGDTHSSHCYRQTITQQQLHTSRAADLSDQRRKLQHCQRKHDREWKKLESMRQKAAKVSEEEQQQQKQEQSRSFIERAFKKVADFFRTEQAQMERQREQAAQENRKRNWERNIRKQERVWKEAADQLESVSTKLTALQDELKALQQPLMPAAEYERMSATAAAVCPDICDAFAQHILERHSVMLEQFKTLDSKTDLTRPQDWFLHARLDKRKIIFHGGPTNSGKTFAALESLKLASKGMYLGPLRLLAAEVYDKLTAEGVYCNLYTGQERREIPFSTHAAATVEMANLTEEYDCIVLDEIQMIADDERGFAWTRALLGSRCKEIHVCGGLEAADLIRRIAESCGDEFELRTYERFTELKVAEDSLAHSSDQKGSYQAVKAGDCVVAFSRDDIFSIKREIETKTRHRCCVIYGSLPPQTRAEQARRFNDPDSGYDVLVASDAIGMGLNLNIRRIIFNSIFKFDGSNITRLGHSDIKQISGRAGRRNSPFPVGEVTTRDPQDMDHLRQCMSTEIPPIERAGLLPTPSHIEVFSDALESYGLGHGAKNLHQLLLQFNDMAAVTSDYFLCKQTLMVVIAKQLASLNLSIREKYMLCMSPVIVKNSKSMEVLQRFASKLESGEVSGLSSRMILRRPENFADLSRLCHIFNEIELFLWLQKKFPPGNQMEEQTALSRKELTVKLIGEGLALSEELKLDHCYLARDWKLRKIWENNKYKKQRSSYEDEEDDINWNAGIQDI